MDDYEYPTPTPDVVVERSKAVLEIACHVDAVQNPTARKLMLRTMKMLVDTIQHITTPEPEPVKLSTVTYLGKTV